MIETLIVLNNYFHDLAISLVFVTAVAMFLLVRYASDSRFVRSVRLRRSGRVPRARNSRALRCLLFRRLSVVFWGSVLYVIVGGFQEFGT